MKCQREAPSVANFRLLFDFALLSDRSSKIEKLPKMKRVAAVEKRRKTNKCRCGKKRSCK